MELAVSMPSQEMMVVVSDAYPSLVRGVYPIPEAQLQIAGIEVRFADGSGVVPFTAENVAPGIDAHCRMIGSQKLTVVKHTILAAFIPVRSDTGAGTRSG
jgi:hypothetical protein